MTLLKIENCSQTPEVSNEVAHFLANAVNFHRVGPLNLSTYRTVCSISQREILFCVVGERNRSIPQLLFEKLPKYSPGCVICGNGNKCSLEIK